MEWAGLWELVWREKVLIRTFFLCSSSFLEFRLTSFRGRSRRTHEQHGHESHTSGGRQIPTELERSQHGSSGLGATSGGVGGIMGAGLDREGHHHDSYVSFLLRISTRTDFEI